MNKIAVSLLVAATSAGLFAKDPFVYEVEMKVKSMEVKGYRYAYLEFAKKAVVGAVMLLGSIAVSLAERTFTLSNVIFYMCLSILLYQSLTPLFGYDKRMEANLLCKARINNVVHLDEINSKK